jgi:hypothetical protein
MELHDFLKKFLPDYEEKVKHYDFDDPRKHDDYLFFVRYFPEALQNYTNQICEQQIQNCCNAYRNSCEKEKYDQWIEHNIYSAEKAGYELNNIK